MSDILFIQYMCRVNFSCTYLCVLVCRCRVVTISILKKMVKSVFCMFIYLGANATTSTSRRTVYSPRREVRLVLI